MLGRKAHTQEELDHEKTAVDQQLAAYKKLVKAKARRPIRRSVPRSRPSKATVDAGASRWSLRIRRAWHKLHMTWE
jgi:multidrug resistance efflux pump